MQSALCRRHSSCYHLQCEMARTKRSQLSAKSTAEEVANVLVNAEAGLKGKHILVTGASPGGIGFETARVLASKGATVILACPTEALCRASEEHIKALDKHADVNTLVLDLSDLKQVKTAAAQVVANGKPLDILINNAGVMVRKRIESKDGYELDFAVNYLGHYLFVNELLPVLKSRGEGVPGARVVHVASSGHWMYTPASGIDYEDLHATKGPFYTYKRYGMSKLALVQHAKEFSRRQAADGIVAVSVHPGMVGGTRIAAGGGLWDMLGTFVYSKFLYSLLTESLKNVPQGAATTVYAALAPLEGSPEATATGKAGPGGIVPGGYYSHCALETRRVHRLASDPASIERLFKVSQGLVDTALAK